MTDKELIKQEIERQFDYYNTVYNMLHPDDLEAHISYAQKELLDRLFQFINSLPEEPANEDLEEEIERCWKEMFPIGWSDSTLLTLTYEQHKAFARHFAEWQKNKMKEALQTEYEKGRFDMREEMMKDAVEAEVMYPASSSTLQIRYKLPKNTKLKYGDKVKIIICKTEQQ